MIGRDHQSAIQAGLSMPRVEQFENARHAFGQRRVLIKIDYIFFYA